MDRPVLRRRWHAAVAARQPWVCGGGRAALRAHGRRRDRCERVRPCANLPWPARPGRWPALTLSHSSQSRVPIPEPRRAALKAGVLMLDLHVYDPAASAWTDLSSAVNGTPPLPRSHYGLAAAEGLLYVQGGYVSHGECAWGKVPVCLAFRAPCSALLSFRLT